MLRQGVPGLEVLVTNGTGKVHVKVDLYVPSHLRPVPHSLATSLAHVLVAEPLLAPLYHCLQGQIKV